MRIALAFATLFFFHLTLAQSDRVALTGQVSSKEEGAMEGVLVSAKRAGSTITVTVVSDAKGRYQFPAARLAPGTYQLRIRAAGYDLAGSPSVSTMRVVAMDWRRAFASAYSGLLHQARARSIVGNSRITKRFGFHSPSSTAVSPPRVR